MYIQYIRSRKSLYWKAYIYYISNYISNTFCKCVSLNVCECLGNSEWKKIVTHCGMVKMRFIMSSNAIIYHLEIFTIRRLHIQPSDHSDASIHLAHNLMDRIFKPCTERSLTKILMGEPLHIERKKGIIENWTNYY